MSEWIGWLATGVFVLSYACRRPMTMRLVQAGGAVLWVSYGLLLDAAPVIVANVLVGGAALFSLWGGRRRERRPREPSEEAEQEQAA
jgi:membrane protein implicated in regulation of membrane protease activity